MDIQDDMYEYEMTWPVNMMDVATTCNNGINQPEMDAAADADWVVRKSSVAIAHEDAK